MRTIPITTARKDIFNIIDQTITNSEPIQITSKKGDVVMLSLADWSAIQETIYLMGVSGMYESIVESDKTPVEEWSDGKDVGWDI